MLSPIAAALSLAYPGFDGQKLEQLYFEDGGLFEQVRVMRLALDYSPRTNPQQKGGETKMTIEEEQSLSSLKDFQAQGEKHKSALESQESRLAALEAQIAELTAERKAKAAAEVENLGKPQMDKKLFNPARTESVEPEKPTEATVVDPIKPATVSVASSHEEGSSSASSFAGSSTGSW